MNDRILSNLSRANISIYINNKHAEIKCAQLWNKVGKKIHPHVYKAGASDSDWNVIF